MTENPGNDLIVLYAIPVFLTLIVFEAAVSVRHNRGWYSRADALASLGMGLGNLGISLLAKIGWLAVYWAVYEQRLFTLDSSLLWVWLAGLLLQDFCFYWYHRCSHRIRLLWVAHEAHHSSEYCNLTTALRQSWLSPFYSFIFFAPMALLGFHPLLIITCQSISVTYQFFLHTESVGKLGPLEWVMNTPSHHRVHHGTNTPYIDTNYGGMLIIWDRLLGTFAPETETVKFGVTSHRPNHNPLRIASNQAVHLLADLRVASSWRQRLGLLINGPEWWPRHAESKRPLSE